MTRPLDIVAMVRATVLAVWDGVSRGTMDSVRRAQRRGIPVRVERFG